MNPEGRSAAGSGREYAWNLKNLEPRDGATGMTIEWRQHPGVTTAEEALAWAELALGFIQAARQPGAHDRLRELGRDVAGLKRSVQSGLVAGVGDQRYYDVIFEGKSGAIDPVGPEDRGLEYQLQRDWWDEEQQTLLDELSREKPWKREQSSC